MYHSKTPEIIKEDIKLDLDDPNGDIRVLVATSAAGIGVHFKGVYHVINYGPPKGYGCFCRTVWKSVRN